MNYFFKLLARVYGFYKREQDKRDAVRREDIATQNAIDAVVVWVADYVPPTLETSGSGGKPELQRRLMA